VQIHNIRPSSTPVAAAPAAAPAPAGGDPQDTAILTRADAAAPGKPEYVPGQVLVKFKPGVGARDVQAFQEKFGLSTIRKFNVPEKMQRAFGGELYQFKLRPGDTVEAAVARLSGQPGVAYAEPNYKIQLDDPQEPAPPPPSEPPPSEPPPSQPPPPPAEVIPNDPRFPELWGLRNTGQENGQAGADVGATTAWATTTGKGPGQGPLIAVIDTGVDYNHPDLAPNIWTNPNEVPGDGVDNDGNGIVDDVHGANIINKTGDPMDDNSHGTHVSGTIGGKGNDGAGVVGVQWDANIAGVKFLDAGGGGTYADAVDAVLYATAIGARVTSNSWGGGGFSQALYDAFKASPALHIAAAGNNGSDADSRPSYPAGFDLDNIVSVAAHDRHDQLADFSNYGATSVDVAAPGVDVLSSVPGGGYDSYSGTSMATPHVSGVVGLMLAHEPDLTNEQIKARLINTAVKGEAYEGKTVAGGRVNAANTLETDEIPPATPADLHVDAAGASSFTLGFTAVGDDGLEGKANSYKVRYSDRPIVANPVPGDDSSVSWDQATPVSGLPRPADPGSQEHLQVAITPDEQPKTYYFALKVFDNMGNESGMATTSGTSLPAAVALKDNFEADSGFWTVDGTWAREAGESNTYYTDSPGGSYEDNANTSLTSGPVDLSGVANPRLLFRMKHDTEANYDYVHLEVTEDGGQTWTELAKFDGTQDWKQYNYDLSAYDGKTIQVRFRLTSDGSIRKDGVSVDDVLIAGDPRSQG
jgi:subtilisin family serine protease